MIRIKKKNKYNFWIGYSKTTSTVSINEETQMVKKFNLSLNSRGITWNRIFEMLSLLGRYIPIFHLNKGPFFFYLDFEID